MSHTLASDESARPVSATRVTPRRRSAGMMALSSLDSPEFEISRQTSPEVTMPRSPCAASAGCTKNDGVPVEASVAAILRPTCPLLPMPMTTTRCSQRRMVSTARANSAVRRRCMPSSAAASISKVSRARCNARSASNGKSFFKVGCLCSRMWGF